MTNHYRRLCLIVLLLSWSWLGHGCQRSDSGPSSQQGSAPSTSKTVNVQVAPPFIIKGLEHGEAVSGTLSLEAVAQPGRIDRVDLWLNQQRFASQGKPPYRFSWDTTRTADGLVAISWQGFIKQKRITEIKQSVVVLNHGTELFFQNGHGGTVGVPPTGQPPEHLRYHWEQQEGFTKIIALLTWSKPGFDLELALGTGTCPHHGVSKASQHGTTSPLIVTYEEEEGAVIATGQWFAHVRLLNSNEVLGRETPFSVRAFAFQHK